MVVHHHFLLGLLFTNLFPVTSAVEKMPHMALMPQEPRQPTVQRTNEAHKLFRSVPKRPSQQPTLANAAIDSQAAFGNGEESEFLQLTSSGRAAQTHAVTSKDGKERDYSFSYPPYAMSLPIFVSLQQRQMWEKGQTNGGAQWLSMNATCAKFLPAQDLLDKIQDSCVQQRRPKRRLERSHTHPH
jgi:hypothetical protein